MFIFVMIFRQNKEVKIFKKEFMERRWEEKKLQIFNT